MPKNEAHVRLDRFLANNLPGYSRSRLQQLIRTGFVTLNGRATRARYLVHTGDKIELTEPPLEKIDNQPEPIPLEILFEDKDIIVINKPPGLVVNPGAGHLQHGGHRLLAGNRRPLSGEQHRRSAGCNRPLPNYPRSTQPPSIPASLPSHAPRLGRRFISIWQRALTPACSKRR